MTDEADKTQSDELANLIAECTERIEREGAGALDTVCEAHPEHAAALREAMEQLLAFGVVGSGAKNAPEPGGRIFGDYQILRELGRGGMGVVFEARQVSLDRPVALKVLHGHLTLDETTIERFKREGRTAGALQDQGMVRAYAIGSIDEHHYLAMELVQGASLDEILGELRNMPDPPDGEAFAAALESVRRHRWGGEPDQRPSYRSYYACVAETGAQLADALDTAHGSGVVHRDIKPSNVLVRPDGRPVITDFGLARQEGLPGLTRTGAFAGTPYYAAPEQAEAKADAIDARTDIFSLGATLYEMLTLRLPFDGRSTREVLRKISLREPVDPKKIDAGIPDDLAAIILKALEKEPHRRYQSAAEMAEDLRGFLAHRPVRARRTSVPGRVLRWSRREPIKASLVVVLALGIPALTGLVSFLIAQRPMVEAAERQAALDLAETALLNGYLASLNNEQDLAETELRDALNHPQTGLEALAGLALRRLNAKQTDAALQLLDEQAGNYPESRVLGRLRLFSLEQGGRFDEANEISERLGPPSESLEHFLIGWMLMDSNVGNFQAADLSRRAMESFRDAVLLSPAPRPIFYFRLAAVAGDLRDESMARAAAAALQAHWPELTFAWEGVGLALEDIDEQAAIDAYRKALSMETGNRARILNNLGEILRGRGDAEGALECFEESAALRPGNAFAYTSMAMVHYYLEEDDDAAIRDAREALSFGGADAGLVSTYRVLMRALVAKRQFDEAAAAMREGIETLPRQGILYRDLATLHMNHREDLQAALSLCEEALEKIPDDPQTYLLRAQVQRAMGDMEAAEASHLRRTELRPREPDAFDQLAGLYLAILEDGSRWNAAKGLAAAQRAAMLSEEKDPWILHTLGVALLNNDRREEAVKVFERGVALTETPPWNGNQTIVAMMRDGLEFARK